jgi:hypothetical protein
MQNKTDIGQVLTDIRHHIIAKTRFLLGSSEVVLTGRYALPQAGQRAVRTLQVEVTDAREPSDKDTTWTLYTALSHIKDMQ